MNGVMRQLAARRVVTAGLTLVLAGVGLTGTAVGASASPARASHAAVVVKERRHGHFGKILYTTHTQALYYLPSGSFRGGCLAIWPPLLMPRGKTVPKGASCLRTVRFGRRLQVTYNHHRLYTFISDTGSSVTGNGVQGFKVAKVVRCH